MNLAAGAVLALLLVAPLASAADPSPKVPRVALVANTVPLEEWRAPRMADGTPHVGEVIRSGLRERGWIDGKSIRIEHRSANGDLARLPAIFEEVVGIPVDVIIAIGPGVNAAARATRTIPIVMSATAAAVDIGLADSLARPGRNVTGLSFETRDEIIGKRLELVKRAVPRVSRVAFLSEGKSDAQWTAFYRRAADAAGVGLIVVPFIDMADIERAFAVISRERADAVLVTDGVGVHRRAYQETINAQAARLRLPVIHSAEGGADHGGLMSYAIDSLGQYKRIPHYVDRILRGAKAADLPIEQPGNPQLVVNLRVARTLGLEVPKSLLIEASRVVE